MAAVLVPETAKQLTFKELSANKKEIRKAFIKQFLEYLHSPETGMQVTDPFLESQLHSQLEKFIPELSLEKHAPARLLSSYADNPLVITHFVTYKQREGTGSSILYRARHDAKEMGSSHIALEDTSEPGYNLTQKIEREEAEKAKTDPQQERIKWVHLPPRHPIFTTSRSMQHVLTKQQYEKAEKEEKGFFYQLIHGLYSKRDELPPTFVHAALPILISKYSYLYTGKKVSPEKITQEAIKNFIETREI